MPDVLVDAAMDAECQAITDGVDLVESVVEPVGQRMMCRIGPKTSWSSSRALAISKARGKRAPF
jgi:hypothetical protein